MILEEKKLQEKVENVGDQKKMRIVGSDISDEKLVNAKLKFVQQQLDSKNEQCIQQ